MASFEKVFVFIALILYTVSSCGYFRSTNNRGTGRVALILAAAGLIANFTALAHRTITSGRLPLANGYEFLLCFACFTVLMYVIYDVAGNLRNAGGPVMLIAALLLLAIVILMPEQFNLLTPLMPALKSPWLASHVLTAVLAYGAFALAAGLAFVQLRAGNASIADFTLYRVVAGGFAMLSLSIVLGAIWAEQAWGSYWSWDPKETWALITWLIYAIYLHLYRQRGWRGREASILIIAGFIIVLFTFFGVNYLMSGLHSYGSL